MKRIGKMSVMAGAVAALAFSAFAQEAAAPADIMIGIDVLTRTLKALAEG